MASISQLKGALTDATSKILPSRAKHLSDSDYAEGFALFTSPPNGNVYNEFTTSTLCDILTPLFDSCKAVSVLEIGPGPKTTLASFLDGIRLKVRRYTAFEPTALFASILEADLLASDNSISVLPGLDKPAEMLRAWYELTDADMLPGYNIILFCHIFYGMSPKRAFIEHALGSLSEIGGELVVVFHRDRCLNFDGLVCHTTSLFDSAFQIPDDDQKLDLFSSFLTGVPADAIDEDVRSEWRTICRSLASRDSARPGQLIYHAPKIMVAFRHAGALQEVMRSTPPSHIPRLIKNHGARDYSYAAIVAPTNVAQVQECVRWALTHKLNLTIIGGSHS